MLDEMLDAFAPALTILQVEKNWSALLNETWHNICYVPIL